VVHGSAVGMITVKFCWYNKINFIISNGILLY
jgi:hypothetical protein